PMRLATARTVHVIGPLREAERVALSQVIGACGSAAVKLWDDSGTDDRAEADAGVPLTPDEHPRGGWLVFLGSLRSAAGWLPDAGADGAVVIATRDEPCILIDRVDELAAAGYVRPALLCATPVLARRLGLPNTAVLAP